MRHFRLEREGLVIALGAVLGCGGSGSVRSSFAPSQDGSLVQGGGGPNDAGTKGGGSGGGDSGFTLKKGGADGASCASGSPNLTGCPCTAGQVVACYTGPAATRGVGPCHDGTQTCASQGEFASFGACTGEVVPTSTATCQEEDASSPRDSGGSKPPDGSAASPPDGSAASPPDGSTPSGDAGAALCADGGWPVAYLLDITGAFYTFDPSTLATNLLGTPACGDSAGAWDFTVSREGNAYVIYEDWAIYEVNLTTLACQPTSYVNGGLFSANYTTAVRPTPTGEEMLYYGVPTGGSAPILARSILTALTPAEVGAIPGAPSGASVVDIKGDAFGHLYGLSSSGVFIQVDPASGNLLLNQQTAFSADDWALLTFNGQVYFFGDSMVSGYDVGTATLTALGSVTPIVVGASAIPCLHP